MGSGLAASLLRLYRNRQLRKPSLSSDSTFTAGENPRLLPRCMELCFTIILAEKAVGKEIQFTHRWRTVAFEESLSGRTRFHLPSVTEVL